jgi:hypothetical protein
MEEELKIGQQSSAILMLNVECDDDAVTRL